MRVFFVVFILLIGLNLHSFPLRNVSVGDKIDLKSISMLRGDYTQFESKKSKKIVFLWRYEKALSKKLYPEFIKICEEKKLPCLSIDLSGTPQEELIKFHRSEVVLIAKADDMLGNKLGVFTLPVTIFLDEDNKIINAIGYEGNYLYKISKYIDFILGRISKDDYEKELKKTEVISKKSHLPDINLAIKNLKEGNKTNAEKIIERIKIDEIDDNEKIKLAEALILMNKLDESKRIIENIKNPMAEFVKAYINFKDKKYDEAIDILEKISMNFPNKKRISHLLGLIYYYKKDYVKAANFLYIVVGEELF